MNMNPASLLALISSLYEQLAQAHARIAELEQAKEPKNG